MTNENENENEEIQDKAFNLMEKDEWYYVEIVQPDGPDDFYWAVDSEYPSFQYEEAVLRAEELHARGHTVRVVHFGESIVNLDI